MTEDAEQLGYVERRNANRYVPGDDITSCDLLSGRYGVSEFLGRGSYGKVWAGVDRTTAQKVAIKRVGEVFEDVTHAKRLLREMRILRKLRHPNIIQLRDVLPPFDARSADHFYLIFDYADTDLHKLIQSNQFLTNGHIRILLYQLLLALKFIHSAGIIHRDIKPANILVSESCQLRLCDFGLARGTDRSSSMDSLTPSHCFEMSRVSQYRSRGHSRLHVDREETARCYPFSHALHRSFSSGESGFDFAYPHSPEDIKSRASALKAGSPHYSYRHASGSTGDWTLVGEIAYERPDQVTGSVRPLPSLIQRQLKSKKREYPVDNNEFELSPSRFIDPDASSLTRHVVTRQYRAPELIVLEDHYDSSIDMWSVGCVLAELLLMQKENSPDYRNRMPLFSGKSCFPLSADDPLAYRDPEDQLSVIFDVLGTPSRQEIKALLSERARTYLSSLAPKPARDLCSLFPGADPLALNLLSNLLKFSPSERLTADEALRHRYHSEIRDVVAEFKSFSSPVRFEFEGRPLTMQLVKDLIFQEVNYHNPELDQIYSCHRRGSDIHYLNTHITPGEADTIIPGMSYSTSDMLELPRESLTLENYNAVAMQKSIIPRVATMPRAKRARTSRKTARLDAE
eukprot:CAMPEP_0184487304 /NCGR_PEP_ID=MMETSP0113_2-20130426/9729_1 /TAXON_ID=91329 /ORGANISM="Norrisiella sphaerica, Strain BC52" /LENGTH=626 /DNA_ID=CAMNT_0026869561 /DNA_START=429 /DNA_END=2309 /DNA_ORIENTATION=-